MSEIFRRLSALAPRLKTSALYAAAQVEGFDNPAWEEASFRLLLVRLSPWRDARRSTPHSYLYALARSVLGGGAFIDFAFFPDKADRRLLDREGLPWLTGIAGRRPAADYDVLLISCSYALELVNLPLLLRKSGIPLRASSRRGESGGAAEQPGASKLPLILMGGSNAQASQGAIFGNGDSFVDGIYFGEAEDGGSELLRILAATAGSPARERLEALERGVGAFWAAGFGPPESADDVRRRVRPGRSSVSGAGIPFLPASYALLNSEEAGTTRLQLSWGCPSTCTFCFEGWERKPYREVPRERLLDNARKLAMNTGASTAELYSFNFNAHSDILALLEDLHRIFDRVNMMSQRADILVSTPGMLACELAAEKRSFTVGVEGISPSMRAYYGKGLSEQDLWALLERLVRERVREIKLFFIIAGVETEGDISDFAALCGRMRSLLEAQGGSGRSGLPRILMSAGYLVRMPFTPLRAAPAALDRQAMEGLARRLKTCAEEAGFEFRLAMDWAEYAADQLLVAGGYALAEGLEAASETGVCYDEGIQGALLDPLEAALRRSGELLAPTDGTRTYSGPLVEEKAAGHRYPLSFIECAVPSSYLDARYLDARDRREGPGCFGTAAAEGRCAGCSACDDGEERDFLTKHRVAGAELRAAERLACLIRDKRRSRPVHVAVKLGDGLAGAEEAYRSALLHRAVLSRCPELVGRLFRTEEACWASPAWRERMGCAGVVGETALALYGLGGETTGGEPCLGREDAERARAALEAYTGTRAVLLESFEAAAAFPKRVTVLLPPEAPEQALARTRAWLASLKVAVVERKGLTSSGRVFELAPKDKKKRILDSAELRYGAERSELLIRGGPKLDLSGLQPSAADRAATLVRIEEAAGL